MIEARSLYAQRFAISNVRSIFKRLSTINWSELRAAAIALGNVQEAAKRAATNLPQVEAQRFIERVNKRSQREQWITKAKTLAPATFNAKPLSNPVQSGSQLLTAALEEDNRETRLGLSKATRKASKVLSEADGDFVLAKSEDLRRIVSSAAQIHNWEKQEEGSGVMGGLRVYSQQTVIAVKERSSDATGQ